MTWAEVERNLIGINHQFTLSLAHILFDCAQKLTDGATILEIGPYQGYTTCTLAYACLGTQKHIWTIDTFVGNPANTDIQDGESYYATFQKNIKTRKLSEYVTVLIGKSEEFYQSWNRPIHMLFIDGNHAPDVVQGDVDAFFPWLTSGGWLFMHDVYPVPKPQSVNPTWLGVKLQLTDCQHSLNLAWGRKREA